MAKRGGFPGGMPGNMNNLMKQSLIKPPKTPVRHPMMTEDSQGTPAASESEVPEIQKIPRPIASAKMYQSCACLVLWKNL